MKNIAHGTACILYHIGLSYSLKKPMYNLIRCIEFLEYKNIYTELQLNRRGDITHVFQQVLYSFSYLQYFRKTVAPSHLHGHGICHKNHSWSWTPYTLPPIFFMVERRKEFYTTWLLSTTEICMFKTTLMIMYTLWLFGIRILKFNKISCDFSSFLYSKLYSISLEHWSNACLLETRYFIYNVNFWMRLCFVVLSTGL
jgi:hypothetical protein